MPGMKPVDKAANPGLSKLPQEVRNKMGYMAKGGVAKKFKACDMCPSPAKCKAAGKCLAKTPSKGSKKAMKGMLVIPVSMTKAPAKKAKKG